MQFAVLVRCPVWRGGLRSFDDTATRAIRGVTDVIRIGDGISVIAASSYAAIRGRDALIIDWEPGQLGSLDSQAISAQLMVGLQPIEGVAGRGDGNVRALFGNATGIVDSSYELPFLAHAPLGPMNCTAEVRDDGVELRVPTQVPEDARQTAANVAGLPRQTSWARPSISRRFWERPCSCCGPAKMTCAAGGCATRRLSGCARRWGRMAYRGRGGICSPAPRTRLRILLRRASCP